MTKGTGPGILLIMGLMLVFGGLMWDAGPGQAWQDMNNSVTDQNSTAHAAVSAGQIQSYGFGLLITAMGCLLMVGAILVLVMDGAKRIGGR